jgi:hypothetical protein
MKLEICAKFVNNIIGNGKIVERQRVKTIYYGYDVLLPNEICGGLNDKKMQNVDMDYTQKLWTQILRMKNYFIS